MAEYEVYVELEGDVDIDIDFSIYTFKEILILLWKVIRGQKVHIHVKANQNVIIKNRCEHIEDKPLYLVQTERLFEAKFRIVTNDDGSKTRIFL